MNPTLVVIVAAIGLIVNTIAILGVAWKGGHILGRLEQAVSTLASEVGTLREWKHGQSGLPTRLEWLERESERREQERRKP